MARAARIVVAGEPHHVTQRGNNRQNVFFTADDRLMYLNLLRDACTECGTVVRAYCLMANHIHLVLVPSTEASLALAMKSAAHAYALFINERHGRRGHLWQSRFYSCPLDETHFWNAVRYVECNPVRAGIVRCAWDFPWSSAKAHVASQGTSRLLDLEAWRAEMAPKVWQATLGERCSLWRKWNACAAARIQAVPWAAPLM
jgi:putative transposase